jgi:hypothetical protein
MHLLDGTFEDSIWEDDRARRQDGVNDSVERTIGHASRSPREDDDVVRASASMAARSAAVA